MIEALRINKRLTSYEHDLVRTDGKIIHAIANIIGEFDNKGNLELLKGYIFDDTERKKATGELQKLSMAIEQSPASVIITDTKGNIEYVNPKFSEVTGYSFDEVLGKNPRILKSGNLSVDTYSELWKKITNGGTWTGEFQNKKKDGTLYWESSSISPIKTETGATTHFLAVKEDITEKKKYEEELIIARDQAQESNRLKSAFLATMSHELRTPLNAIIGFSGLVDKDVPKPEIIKYSNIINKSGNHLLNIIEDIFSVSLLQTGHSKIILEKFDLSDLLLTLSKFANIEIINKNKNKLKLSFKPEIKDSKIILNSDRTKLFQVLINFIKNAIEYSDSGKIEIGYSLENDDIEFYVKDTGIGIQADKMEIIFEQFRQIDDTHTRIHGGVGLGLAICSEIAKLLEGKIWAESIHGKGSTFFFSIKNVINRDRVLVEQRITLPDLKNNTILIAEDEELNYLLLETYLIPTGANVIWAKNGEESIEYCKNNPQIDLVLMDIRMPGIDGLEATKQIKVLRPELTIIAQTAYALDEERVKILSSGCEDCISKPIKPDNLMKVLKIHFKK